MSLSIDHFNELQVENKRLRELVDAQSQLLAAYRLGSHRMADAALTRMEKAKAALAEGGS